MSLETYNEVCYHGTTTSCAQNIILSGKWIESTKDTEWLGTGVYFFEKDPKQAYDFMSRARREDRGKISVLKVEITADKMMDLDMTENFNLLLGFKDTLLNKLTTQDPCYYELKIGVLMDFMNSIVPYDAIRKSYVVPGCNPVLERTKLVRTQVQVCVKNHGCITNVERMANYGC